MKHRDTATKAPAEHLTAVDATVGPDTEAFWKMRERDANRSPVPPAGRAHAPHALPGAASADKHRYIMRQPGRAAGGRRLG